MHITFSDGAEKDCFPLEKILGLWDKWVQIVFVFTYEDILKIQIYESVKGDKCPQFPVYKNIHRNHNILHPFAFHFFPQTQDS